MANDTSLSETGWLRCDQHATLWNWLGRRLTPRKRTLFGCACCRQVWHLLTHPANRVAVETSERFADGLAGVEELRRAWQAIVWEPAMYYEWPAMTASGPGASRQPTEDEVRSLRALGAFPQRRPDRLRDRQWSDVLRELFGNPFRRVLVSASWLAWHGGTVRKMAQAIYDGHRWEEMPVLADALEEAGCDEPDLLAHCRAEATHTRGCWALDRLLGKK